MPSAVAHPNSFEPVLSRLRGPTTPNLTNGALRDRPFFNKFAGKAYEDKRPLQRYVDESKRLLGVLDRRLEARDWIMGADYSIADISTLGWIRNLITFYEARDLVAFDSLKNVPTWLDRGLARPAVQRGLEIPQRP